METYEEYVNLFDNLAQLVNKIVLYICIPKVGSITSSNFYLQHINFINYLKFY